MARSPRALPTQGPTGVIADDISKQIIEQLQQDGRRSYAAIGKAVGLSEAAVRQRVQRLHDAGVMQIVAVTDPLTLGFRRQAMIAIKTDGDLEKVAGQLADMEEIDYVAGPSVTGVDVLPVHEVLQRAVCHLQPPSTQSSATSFAELVYLHK